MDYCDTRFKDFLEDLEVTLKKHKIFISGSDYSGDFYVETEDGQIASFYWDRESEKYNMDRKEP